jgi:predicted DNA-binding WGR domain protein
MPRHFEFVSDTSAKFWEIVQQGNQVTVRFGRLDTPGQTQTKTFRDDGAASRHVEKMVGQKTTKGYVET